MTWFLLALAAQFLWAAVNISDQYLVARYTDDKSPAALILFSALIGIFASAVILFFVDGIFAISTPDIALLLFLGVLEAIWFILYLYALYTDDLSSVVPWFLTIPIFGYLFGYIFLGETLSGIQIFGCIVVLIGALILSIDFSAERTSRFKTKVVLYMIPASILVAVIGALFKSVTVGSNFWISAFWTNAGLGITGLLMFIFMKRYRRAFMSMIRQGGKKIFGLNMASEITTTVGNLFSNFALLLAPITMIYLIGSFQPVIVLILTIICSKFFPNIVSENMTKNVLRAKIVALVVMIVGSAIVFLY